MSISAIAYKKQGEEVALLHISGPNWHNAGARGVLELLGVVKEGGDIWDTPLVSLPEARCMVARAKMRLQGNIDRLLHGERIEHGPPRMRDDGVIELNPIRCYEGGAYKEDFERRIHEFENFIEDAHSMGADLIGWG